jgi:hypothetical protein
MENSTNWAEQYAKENNIVTGSEYELLYEITNQTKNMGNNELNIEYLCDGKNDETICDYTDALLDKLYTENLDINAVQTFWAGLAE